MTESRGRKIEERSRIERRAMRIKTVGQDREIGKNLRRAVRKLAGRKGILLDTVLFLPPVSSPREIFPPHVFSPFPNLVASRLADGSRGLGV